MAEREVLFDVQAPGGSEPIVQVSTLLARVSAALVLAYFSFYELSDELRKYRQLRKGITDNKDVP